MKSIRRNQGLIETIVLIVIALIILGYFGVDVRRIVNMPQVQENLSYGWGIMKIAAGEVWTIILLLYRSLIDLVKELIEILPSWREVEIS